jgi:hypothetical protein
MSFNGDYVTEGTFNSIQEAWERSEDMGSRWYFYPFHFVTTESGKTVRATPELLEHLNGVRVREVARHFASVAATPEAANANVEQFMFMV